jgi:hypothetical protein
MSKTTVMKCQEHSLPPYLQGASYYITLHLELGFTIYMITNPASTKWRGAYYACHICKHNADFICPRGLVPICADCKARYVGIFGYEAFEIIKESHERKKV